MGITVRRLILMQMQNLHDPAEPLQNGIHGRFQGVEVFKAPQH